MKALSKILVIDDESGVCEDIKHALASTGYQVVTTTSSQDGLQRIREDGYDLVLLDVMMPDTNSIDLIADIHAHDPEIVCVIITGCATLELAVNAIKRGAYDFLTKPFSVDDLTLAIEQGLERRRLSIEAKRAREAEKNAIRLAEEKARLEELDRAKRQFFRLVTHELQAPIEAIQTYLHLMRDGYIPDEKMPEILEKCLARAEEGRALVADLLELSQLEALGADQGAVPTRLDVILQEVAESLKEQIENKRLRFVMEIAPGLPEVLINPTRGRSLWLNLLSNAMKYTPENGSIVVKLYLEAGQLLGEVTDTGIGIPLEDQKRLFTEFFRAANARSMGVPGTGLGLAIVKRIVEGLGGQIRVVSDVGRGTTFSFAIPVESNQPQGG